MRFAVARSIQPAIKEIGVRMLFMQRLVRLVLISAVMVGCAVKPVVDEPQEPMTASQESVSYTHLTLPTKCSV